MALQNEIELMQPISYIASTKLNICAILSQLKRHEKAIVFANSAISDLLITLQLVRIKNLEDEAERNKQMDIHNYKQQDLDIPETDER